MDRVEKIIRRMCQENLPADWRFEDVKRVMEYLGYGIRTETPHNNIFVRSDAPAGLTTISFPAMQGRKVKPFYVRRIRDKLLNCENYA